MSNAVRTIRFLTIHLLIVSIGAVGLTPMLIQGGESSRVERDRSTASVQQCCCGTASGVCCGHGCCGMPKPEQRQCPTQNGNDNSGPTFLAINFTCPVAAVSADGTRLTRLASELCQPSGIATLQTLHVRLDA